jgi:small nuclear ribonucleoprotein D3
MCLKKILPIFNFLHLLSNGKKMKSGEIYRGLLVSAEDTMNMTLSEVVRTGSNGHVSKLPGVYLRGGSIRFISLPDLLKNAPVFKKVVSMKNKAEIARQEKSGGTKRKRD